MYAIIDYKHWRSIVDASELQPGETMMETPPVPTVAQQFDDYMQVIADGVSGWLDAYVQATYSYDSIVSAASYAGDKNATFNAEGTAAKAWRSDCFAALYAAVPTYQAMPPDQWPTIDYVTAHLPQPSSYVWDPPA